MGRGESADGEGERDEGFFLRWAGELVFPGVNVVPFGACRGLAAVWRAVVGVSGCKQARGIQPSAMRERRVAKC